MLRRWRRTGTQVAASQPAIAGYRDLQLVGSGGFSKVYTAYQERFARTVAVKVITVELSDDALRRFRREQLTAGQLDGHPHVIRVYESGTTDDGLPYLTMEYHQQGSLADRVRRQGPLPVGEVLSTGVKLACALEAAHRRGIVHRDVKPQNVLLSPFVGPILADFGIAAFDDARLQTVTSEAFSVFHVAPEVLDGHPATPAADLYALVSTLYELLAGRAPFAGHDGEHDDTRGLRGGGSGSPGLLQYMRRVRTGSPAPIDRSDVPPQVAGELVALLAREPSSRPPSALALGERLRALEGELGLTPTPLVGFTSEAPPMPAPLPSPPTPPPPPPPPAPSPAPAPAPVVPPYPEPPHDATATFHPVGPRPTPTPPTGRPGRPPWLVAGGAVVAGALVGAGAWFLLGRDDAGADRRPQRSTTTAATEAGAPPPCPVEGASQVNLPGVPLGPGVPPTLLQVQLSDDGTVATVRWDDPNGGRNPYLVVVHCDAPEDDDRQVVAAVAAGEATEVAVDELPLDQNYCFTVGVLQPDAPASFHTAQDGTHYLCLDQTRR